MQRRQTNEEIIDELTKDLGVSKEQAEEVMTGKIPDDAVENSASMPEDDDDSKGDIDEEFLKTRDSQLSEAEIQQLKEEAEALKDEGNDFYKAKKYEEAAISYTRGLRTCPLSCTKERSILYANRAAAKSLFMDKESAITDCEKAVELDPTYVKALLRCAHLYEETDKLDQALSSFNKILEIDRRHIEALVATKRLGPIVHERNEKMKAEVLDKLKDLGNSFLRPFGLSTDNFMVNKNEDTGSYSINFNQNKR